MLNNNNLTQYIMDNSLKMKPLTELLIVISRNIEQPWLENKGILMARKSFLLTNSTSFRKKKETSDSR